MIENYQLHYVIAVAEAGSFTKAAARRNVTQPTLSAGIQKLEQHLGVRLFDRGAKHTRLTDAGQRFLDRAHIILHQCQLAETEVTTITPPGVLRLGILSTIPISLVQSVLQGFARERPGLAIELYEGPQQDILTRLNSGGLDIALTLTQHGQDIPASPLYTEPYYVIIATSHPLAAMDVIAPEDLAGEPAILRSQCESLDDINRFFRDRAIAPRLVYRSHSDERTIAMIAAGVGFAIMPKSYENTAIRAVPLNGFTLRRQIGLLRPRKTGRADMQKETLLDAFETFTKTATQHYS